MVAVIIFYISDLLVLATFNTDNDMLDAIVWFTYLPILFLISISQTKNFRMFEKTRNEYDI